ncbi:uncharacterized protein LOC129579223 [Sitodiplosis mosellana]|uniref:uncharacterized protein LOC129579223 n=1 Tax=Sitodiplosis mosellana TaxID=263140 RepID=UPI00244412E1|nr:uncharacterized protein LOC129579223 [Sitodiplosis mosellana]
MKFYGVLLIFLSLQSYQFAVGEVENLQQRRSLLENQVQTVSREQQHLANQLARNGVYQVENSAKQLQIAQTVQTLTANVLASKGLNDLNGIERSLSLSSGIRQCYQLNKFSFSDAIGTAKNTAIQCITDKFNEGKTIVDNAINNIRSAVQDINGGAQLIAECSQFTVGFPSVAGLVAKVTCLTKALLNMKSGAILLPINLSRRVVEANAAISTIQSDIIKCNVDILSAIIAQSTKAGQAIIDCIGQSASVNIVP